MATEVEAARISGAGVPVLVSQTYSDGSSFDLVNLPDLRECVWVPTPPKTAEEVEYERRQELRQIRREHNSRPHCSVCGRFVPKASLSSYRHHYEDNYDDHHGQCAIHGRQEVVWQE